MASPIPTTAYHGLVRPHGSQLLEFCPPSLPHKPPKVVKMVTKRTPIHEQFTTNQFWGASRGLLGKLQGPKKHQIQKVPKKSRKNAKWSIHWDLNLRTFPRHL